MYKLKNTDIINGAIKQETLDRLSGVKSLKIDNYYLTTLPMPSQLPRLQVLEVISPQVKHIPKYGSLKILMCQGTAIKKIPACPNLTFIDCGGCRNLIMLPKYLNELKELYCVGTKIKDIPEYPKLKILDCSMCNKLEKMPYLKKLTDLVANNCNAFNKKGIKNSSDYIKWRTNVDTFIALSKLNISDDIIRALYENL